jgi:hypothetical protein
LTVTSEGDFAWIEESWSPIEGTLLGARPRKEKLRRVISQLCSSHWRTSAWLAQQLNLDPGNLAERHLGPMVKAGSLERRFPDSPNHPEQAYRASLIQVPLLLGTTA